MRGYHRDSRPKFSDIFDHLFRSEGTHTINDKIKYNCLLYRIVVIVDLLQFEE